MKEGKAGPSLGDDLYKNNYLSPTGKDDDHKEIKVHIVSPHLNLNKALLCSTAFLGLYTSLYSAQNVQSVLFDDDNFVGLGFYSNAVVYLGQGSGSIFCVFICNKIGDSKSMAYASLFAMPFIISLMLPACKSVDLTSPSFWLSNGFVIPVVLFTSLLNGLGEGVS